MKKNLFFATLVATMLLVGSTVSAARNNYSDWFDLDRINAIDVDEDLTDEASREEIGLMIAHLCNSYDALPSKAILDFDDDKDFMSSKSKKTIEELSSTGIVCGYPDNTFRPENDITRAEALTIILRTVDYLSLETESYRRGSSFSDTEGHWAEVYIERAYEQGLVSGYGNGRFYPDDEISREEVITILVNLMGESNNPLIAAIDEVYDLEFDNPINTPDRDYYDDDDDDRYNKYDDDDEYEEKIERPVVNTGSSKTTNNNNNTSSSTSGSSKRPTRPVVDTTKNDDNIINTGSNATGGKPTRPVVDTTTNSTPSTSRPTVDVDEQETVNSRPTRPTV